MDMHKVETDKYDTDLRDWYDGDDPNLRGTLTAKGRVSYVGIAVSLGSAPHKMASVLEHMTGVSFPNGRDVGRWLRTTHLAIQSRLVQYLVGILVGIGENDVIIDDRNRYAVALCKAITLLLVSDVRFEELGAALAYMRTKREYTYDDYVRH